MRKVVRAAYSGKWMGSSEIGVKLSCDSGANSPRDVSPRKAMRPMTTMNANTSQRVASSRRKTKGSKRFIRAFSQDRRRTS